ncbi:DUF2066 domain-containing protein [Pseudoalteromonas sp. MMG010]|uniref:DUF2066 domain-containing protein n=1 Tax=Pseudoalteromonas sp. MMG010 TaxID=2822685 RepID=UPI001B3A5C08|nr:DUF2066 domain-containing protein [Pseudoalteromonas sp. MMG010]
MFKFLATFILFISAVPVYSVEVSDLYQDTLQVDDKSRDARLTASREALLNVLVKVSGDENVADSQIARTKTKNISDYMLKFEYDEKRNGELNLVVKFEQTKINQLIKELQLPLWGVQRPLVAIWLAIEDNYQRELVTQESYPQLEQLIYDVADKRGLPVVIPLLDLQDRAIVGIPEVWGNFSSPIEQASKRYRAERSVTARMYLEPQSTNWVLDWRFTNDEQFDSNRLSGDQHQVVMQMVEDIVYLLRQEYAIDPNSYNEQSKAILTLKNTANFADIELAKRRLSALSVITEVKIISKTLESVQFSLRHTGSLQNLKKALGLDTHFVEYVDPQAFYHVVSKDSLEYQWNAQ